THEEAASRPPSAAALGSALRAYKSLHRLCLRELPGPVEDLLPWAVEAHHVVPARRDRQAARRLAVVAAALDSDRAVLALLRRDVVDRVGVVLVLLVVPVRVVDADRPEAVHGHVLNGEPVDDPAVVLGRRDVEVEGRLLGIAPPSHCAA